MKITIQREFVMVRLSSECVYSSKDAIMFRELSADVHLRMPSNNRQREMQMHTFQAKFVIYETVASSTFHSDIVNVSG